MESNNATPNTNDLKQQIRRRIFERDFQRGEAASSRFAAFFVTCPTCKGTGKQQQWARYDGHDVCERWTCEACDGAGFVERAPPAQAL